MKLALFALMATSVLYGGIGSLSTSHDLISQGSSVATFSHTVNSGTNRILVVMASGSAFGIGLDYDNPTSITYGGVALTKEIAAGGPVCEIWKLVNPPAGTANIVVTLPRTVLNSWEFVDVAGVSFTGVDPTTPFNATSSLPNSVTVDITTTVNNSWLVGAVVNDGGGGAPYNGELTQIWGAHAGLLTAGGYRGPLTAGTWHWRWAYGGGTPEGIVVVAMNPYIPPAAPPTANSTQTAMGLGAMVPSGNRPSLTITPVITHSQLVTSGGGGDTQFCTWASAAILPGVYGGGSIICSYNDGGGFGCGSASNCLYKYGTYDPAGFGSVDFANVNTMTSYGIVGDFCYDGAPGVPKTRSPIAMPGGLLFLPTQCLDNQVWGPRQSGMSVSPDGGAHWCNYKTYQAHSSGHGCDATNWRDDGDFPTDAAGFQWPLTVGNKMGELQLVDFLCQDNSINCPIAEGVDPNYLYFLNVDGNDGGSGAFIARVPKGLGIRMMDPENYQIYTDSGIWTSNVQDGEPLGGVSYGLQPCCSRISFLKDFGLFASWPHGGTYFMTSKYPWGPWEFGAPLTFPTNEGNFPSPVAGLCPKYVGGRVMCTVSTNGESSQNLHLHEVDLGPIGKPFTGIR